MRYISLTFCMTIGLLLSSCKGSEDIKKDNNENYDTYVCPSPQDNKPEMYSISSKTDTIIGRGYDIMGNFLSTSNLKECVINVPDSEIERMKYLSSDASPYIGSDANNYLQDIMYTNGFSENESSTEKKLFTGSIKDYYGKNPSDFSTSHQFAGKDVFFTETIIKASPNVTTNNIKYRSRYLSGQFKKDLNSLTPYQLVLKYGTHVLCNAFIGIRIHGITNCVVTDSKKNVPIDAFFGLSARMMKTVGVTNLYVSDKDKEARCNGGTLHVDFNGGHIDKVKYTNDKDAITADYNKWWNSDDIDNDHFALTELHKDDLIPLYEFIADSTKKADVKKAVEQYISDNQIEEKKMLPLFQALIGHYHKYFTSYEDVQETSGKDAPDSRKCKSPLGLIYQSQESGTVPLYVYSNGKNDRLTTSGVIEDAGDYQNVGIIGYAILSKPVQPEASVAVYEIWNGSDDYAYTTENMEFYGSNGTWKKTGNVFYIVKL